MPTKIMLSENEPPPLGTPTKRTRFAIDEEHALPNHHHHRANPQTPSDDHSNLKSSPAHRASSRKIVGFRASIIREPALVRESKIHLSKTDIRASPRLVGHIFQLLASTVMLISVLKFYANDDTIEFDGVNVFETVNGPIFRWKFIGCVAVSSAGTGIYLLVALVHFDTFFFPQLWLTIFKDGSKHEKIFLVGMLFFWAGGLHISTSTLSVGASQPNIFFGSWITFLSSALNCGVWRISAGCQSIAEKINLHYRETTYNWLWTLFFVAISAGAIFDLFLNRDYVTIYVKGEEIILSKRAWIALLALMWSFVAICIIALLCNHYVRKSFRVKLCRGKRIIVGWRQVEGIVALGMVGSFFWFIYEYTGVDGVLSGLANGYFGLWGTFINSVFTLGTWLRENRDIEYIVRFDTDEG